jgi:hypothetical protein
LRCLSGRPWGTGGSNPSPPANSHSANLTLGMHPAARADPPRPELSVTFRRPPVDDSRDRTDHDPEAQNRGTDRMLRSIAGELVGEILGIADAEDLGRRIVPQTPRWERDGGHQGFQMARRQVDDQPPRGGKSLKALWLGRLGWKIGWKILFSACSNHFRKAPSSYRAAGWSSAFSWLGRTRRLAEGFENLAETLATFVRLASSSLPRGDVPGRRS